MGCTPSSEVSPADKAASKAAGNSSSSNGHVATQSHHTTPAKANSNQVTGGGDNNHHQVTPTKQETNNNQDSLKNDKHSVAFEIGFESQNRNADALLSKHPPKRLQRLAPLPDNAPKLSEEQLKEKIRIAEQNRENELNKKRDLSRRSSRLRQEVMRAREVEKIQDQNELDEKQRSADVNRQKKQQEMAEKKRLREERAHRARERAEKLRNGGGDELDYEIEKDEAFNQDDNDSWLEGENNTSDYHTDNDRFNSGQNQGDHVYNGRTSPSKTPRKDDARQVSAFSSSTTDSHNFAFQRNGDRYDRQQAADDFFDT